MKIALIGYGKMGKAIERIAIDRGHEITVRIDADNQSDFDSDSFLKSDIAIEFTTPKTAIENYKKAFERGISVVSGSTGWTEHMDYVRDLCRNMNATLLWSSNFSIGVNIFFALNKYLARIMGGFPQYVPEMTEIHHIHKLDHPSGTAITLAEGIMKEHVSTSGWNESDNHIDGELSIHHRREGEVPGTHIINWESTSDTITIEHKAKSRDGFALGAVVAAEWCKGKHGFLTMDMLMNELISNNQ